MYVCRLNWHYCVRRFYADIAAANKRIERKQIPNFEANLKSFVEFGIETLESS